MLGEMLGEEINNIFKIFKTIIVIGIIECLIFVSIMVSYQGNYDKNIFVVKLSEENMALYYTEKYRNNILPIRTGTEGNTYDMFGGTYKINKISIKSDKKLDVKEYEVYDKNGYRIDRNLLWLKNDYFEYKEVNNNSLRLIIKQRDKVLYDDKFIEDVNKYLNNEGRYYIHIYSTRKTGIISNVKTHISFNVIVEDDTDD